MTLLHHNEGREVFLQIQSFIEVSAGMVYEKKNVGPDFRHMLKCNFENQFTTQQNEPFLI